MSVTAGDEAPDFRALMPDGSLVQLSDYSSSLLLLIFLRHLQ